MAACARCELRPLARALCSRAFDIGEVLLAQAYRARCNLEVLVLGHDLEATFDGEFKWGDEVERFVGSLGAHVGELFSFRRVYHHLFTLRGVADYHSFVDFERWADVEHAAIL